MKGTLIQSAILILLVVVLALQLLALGRSGARPPISGGVDTEGLREIASALKSEGLYAAALKEYEKLLERGDLKAEQKANILLLMGDMQREELKDYEGALASYVRLKALYPETGAMKKAEREMVTCLEFLDRGRDAERQLAKVTDLKPKADTVKPSDVVVARIGEDRKITLRELEREIGRLDEYTRKTFETPEKKLEFLQLYVAKELMANMALRKGYDKDPQIRAEMEQIRQNLLARRIHQEEVQAAVTVSESDLDLYYRANQEKYTEPEKVRVAHIQVSDEAKAREIVESVTPGTDFAALAKRESEDRASGEEGGVVAPFNRGGYVPGIGRADAFVKAAFAVEIGDVTGPVKTDKGYHVLKSMERIPQQVRPFEEVKGIVERAYRMEKEGEAYEALIQRLMEAQDAVIYANALKEEES